MSSLAFCFGVLTFWPWVASFFRMLERYPHVFRYGAPRSDGKQRWAFRFSIVDTNPIRDGVKGRPGALATVLHASYQDNTNQEHFYLSAEEAAVECDAWKFHLNRNYAMQKFTWSLGSYDRFAVAYAGKHKGASPQDYNPSRELTAFINANAEVWQRLACFAVSGAWNPESELHQARRAVNEGRNNPEVAEERQRRNHAILDWANRFKHHMALRHDVEAYGAGKLEAEAKMNVDMLEKLHRYTHNWPRPENPHWDFRTVLEGMAEDRKQVEKLLAAMKARKLAVETFLAKLSLDTEALKKERMKI